MLFVLFEKPIGMHFGMELALDHHTEVIRCLKMFAIYYHGAILQIQSNLIISNSLISNYRLSRSENLVPVLTWNYDNR